MSDPKDTAMSEAFRASLEEAIGYERKDDCLDFIAQKGAFIYNAATDQ